MSEDVYRPNTRGVLGAWRKHRAEQGEDPMAAEDEFHRFMDYHRAEAIREASMRVFGYLHPRLSNYADDIEERSWPE